MKKSIRTAIKILIGIVILLMLYLKIGPHEILSNLKRIAPLTLIFVLFIYIINRLIDGFNVHILIKCISKKMTYLKTLKYYIYSWSVGMFLPSKIGELSFAYFFKNEDIKPEEAFAIQLLDKAITLTILIPIGLCGMAMIFSGERALLTLAIMLALTLAALLILKFAHKLSKGIREKITTASNTLKKMWKGHKKAIALNFTLTIIKLVVLALITKTIFVSLNADIPLISIIMINSITLVVGLIPISVSGLGIRQALGTYLYALFGISPAVSLAMYTITLILNYGTAGIFAGKLLVKK